jgi:hypothetical protein
LAWWWFLTETEGSDLSPVASDNLNSIEQNSSQDGSDLSRVASDNLNSIEQNSSQDGK